MSLDQDKNRHYSLRKLSVGLASVLIGISFVSAKGQVVKADSIRDNAKSAINEQALKPEKQDMQASILKGTSEPTKQNVENVDMAGIQEKTPPVQNSVKQENSSENSNSSLSSNDVFSLNKNTQTGQNNVPRENRAEGTQPQEKQQTSFAQNSAAESQKNSLNNLDQQKTVTQSGDQVEDNSQTQNEQKLDITKNSKKFAKKVLATNLIATPPMTNGGFDEATWGKLDVTKWQGSVQDGVYELTNYTGDSNHIIVPNEADFEQAGKSTNGLQVGITSDTVRSILLRSVGQTIAFSKTNNQKVKAIDANWSQAFVSTLSKFDGSNLDVSNVTDMSWMFYNYSINDLTSLANWDVSNVTNMFYMFGYNRISDLTPLANWNTSKVTNMSSMFASNSISDLTPLTNWNVSNVTNMNNMFSSNKVNDLTPLAHWDTSNVTNMSWMFEETSISDLTPLAHWDISKVTDMSDMFTHTSISNLTPLANWDVSKVTYMSGMFADNPDITDLKPIANWNISNVDFNNWDGDGFAGLFGSDTKLNLMNINNTTLMQGFLKTPRALQGSTFITNNVDLAKATTSKDLPNLTNTAKRTITFNLPNDVPKTIVQIINYKTIAPVQIEFNPDSDSDSGEIVQTYPVKESDWYLDTSKPNDVTVNGQPSTEYKAYTLDPNDKDIDFAAIPIPKIPGYKAKISLIPSGNSVQPAMFLVSFVALPNVNLGTQNAPDDTKQDQDAVINTKQDQDAVINTKQDQDAVINTKQDQDAVINTKQDQDAVINTKHLNTANMQVVSNQPVLLENADNSVQMLNTANNLQTLNTDTNTSTWQIENSVADELIAPYVVFNSNYKLDLPRFNNYNLQIIKRTSNKDNLSFVYLNQNKTFKYVFNIKIEDGKYLLSISQIENKRFIPVQQISFNDYHQLIKLIVKLINK